MVHDDWRPPYQTAQALSIEPEEEEVSLPAEPVLEKREEPEPMPGISETNSVETLEKPAEEPVENISLTEEPEEAPASRLIGEVFGTYLLMQQGEDQLVLIDKHAAHERLYYEKLRREGGGFPKRDTERKLLWPSSSRR